MIALIKSVALFSPRFARVRESYRRYVAHTLNYYIIFLAQSIEWTLSTFIQQILSCSYVVKHHLKHNLNFVSVADLKLLVVVCAFQYLPIKSIFIKPSSINTQTEATVKQGNSNLLEND